MTEEPLLPKTQSDSLDFITLLIYCATISSITVFLHDYILDRHLGACRITAEIKNDIHLLNVDAGRLTHLYVTSSYASTTTRSAI